MNLLSVFSLYVSFFSGFTTAGFIRNCLKEKTKHTIKSMKYSIQSKRYFENISLSILATSSEKTYNGTVINTIYHYPNKTETIIHPLCYYNSCSVSKGLFVFNRSYPLYHMLNYKGVRKITIEWNDTNNKRIFCVSMRVYIGDAFKQLIVLRPKDIIVIPLITKRNLRSYII